MSLHKWLPKTGSSRTVGARYYIDPRLSRLYHFFQSFLPVLPATFSRIKMKGVQGVMTRWTEPWPWSRASRYGLALLATALVLVLRGVLDPVIGGYIPYLAVLPAVLFAARCCGWGPSLLVILVAFLGEQYWFIPPVHSLRIVGAAERTGTLVYFFVCFTIIIFAETSRRAMAKLAVTTGKLRQASEELGRSYGELELRVAKRTSQLQQKNDELINQAEVVRELSGRLLQMQDEERRRIARELHDSVGQIIAAMSINLAKVERERDHLSSNAAHAITENSSMVQELSRQIRTISHLLHPPLLDEVGLASALQCYVEGFSERSKIQVSLEMPADFGRLSPEMETAIFRIVQECLTNVHRHSTSSTALVRIANTANQLRVEVQDHGKGIPPNKQSEMECAGKTGVGMRGMRERLRQFGGQLEVNSSPGLTLVVATLPIRQLRGKSAASS
jgi:signal transduction histidine kinase